MSAFILKIVAIITMLIDHIGAFILLNKNEFAHSQTYYVMRSIGRMAFPIFAYFIANGCKHTKNINKYLLRLGIFALLSEVIFDIAQKNEINFFFHTNIFYTLFLAVLGIAIYEKGKSMKQQWLLLLPLLLSPVVLLYYYPRAIQSGFTFAAGLLIIYAIAAFCLASYTAQKDVGEKVKIQRKIIPFLAMLPLLYLSEFLRTDYSSWGVGFIILLYLANPENRLTRTIAMILSILYFYGYKGSLFVESWSVINGEQVLSRVIHPQGLTFMLCALVPVVLILLYNGKQGSSSKVVKWGFYAFYPIHIAALVAIRYLLA